MNDPLYCHFVLVVVNYGLSVKKRVGFIRIKGDRDMLGAQIHGTNHINNSVFIIK